jgi:O-acetylhomoserine/O-acetylserine sulfhydrylase-like pyridoxal-dependent enzyme
MKVFKDGQYVDLTADEENAFEAQRAQIRAEIAARLAEPKPPSIEQRLAALETEVAALKAASKA